MNLALKYRPQRLEEVAGQESAVSYIKSLIKSKYLPSALIFSGIKGTGKTTMARILARAFTEDILEIDSASYRKAEEFETLKQQAYYMHMGWKIFILDEVHTLSVMSFNTLLKLLEEPPERVVFILITTDVNKVPVTVLSRCIPVPFYRVKIKDIVEFLQEIIRKEGFDSWEDAAVQEIAYLSGGSVRDAVMMLERLNLEGVRTSDGIRERLGYTQAFLLLEFLKSLGSGIKVGLEISKILWESGIQADRFKQDLMERIGILREDNYKGLPFILTLGLTYSVLEGLSGFRIENYPGKMAFEMVWIFMRKSLGLEDKVGDGFGSKIDIKNLKDVFMKLFSVSEIKYESDKCITFVLESGKVIDLVLKKEDVINRFYILPKGVESLETYGFDGRDLVKEGIIRKRKVY